MQSGFGGLPLAQYVNRLFRYDGLSRLYFAGNPESGFTCYGTTDGTPPGPGNCTPDYDANGNLLAKTDARGVTTNYAYDALNRLTSKTYSGPNTASTADQIALTTPSSCYQYDTAPTGATGGNFIGRLVYEWTQYGACPASLPASGYQSMRAIMAYDPMGRIKQEQQCNLGTCVNKLPYNSTYSYDLAGSEVSLTNGLQGLNFSKTYDTVGRLLTVQVGSNSWLSGDPLFTHSTPIYSVQSFAPTGAIQQMTLGTGVVVTKAYDNRLRSTTETAVHP
jgi:YD repeat-containing protein